MEPACPPRTEILPGLWLDARRALYIAPLRLLVVADLHWGYAASHRHAGNLLPLWGDQEIAHGLRALIADYRPAEMLWLGDSLHTLRGRASAEAFLQENQGGLSATILLGNHDIRWSQGHGRTLDRPGFHFHHGDAPSVVPEGTIEVIGHHHPALSWNDGAGSRLKLPALVASPRRLILPAFSPWAAGTPWNDHLQPGETLWAVSRKRILGVSYDDLRFRYF